MGTNLSTEAIVISIYGGTSWTQITDRFLIGASSTYAASSTGGSSTHTITTSELAAHTHTGPSHTHTLTAKGSISGGAYTFSGSSATTSSIGDHTHSIYHSGTTYQFSNVPVMDGTGSVTNWLGGSQGRYDTPYLNSTGGHSHTVTAKGSISIKTNPTFTGSSATTSSAGTGNTGSTGSGSAMSILNPYYAVYIWVRTA